jgi:hypothetical protein
MILSTALLINNIALFMLEVIGYHVCHSGRYVIALEQKSIAIEIHRIFVLFILMFISIDAIERILSSFSSDTVNSTHCITSSM